MRSTPEITLHLQLADDPGVPLPARLAGQLRELIAGGVLSPGEGVPSTRALAAHLGISRGSVVAAYDQLLAEGYLSATAGGSTTVNSRLLEVHPMPIGSLPVVPSEPGPLLDLRPARPWAQEVVGPAWKAAWRQASSRPVESDVPPQGIVELRRALAEQLRRMRGVVRDSEQLAVTAGGREGLSLLLAALGHSLRRPLRVGVEEPGYPSLRRVPFRLGATVVPMAVDGLGLRVSDLPEDGAAPDVVLVTPSHQYPLGGSLPVDRRQALLEWARRNEVVVVEDDYDSELRYTSQPLPALAALDDPVAGRVVLLGTFAKTLTPTLAAGFLALPGWLVPAIVATRRELGLPVGLVTQRALANYLDSGALRLHTQRMRTRYRRRRAEVMDALTGVPGLRIHPMDGGLHVVVEFWRPEVEVVASLAGAGVAVSRLSEYWSGADSRNGIVFGLGAVSEAELSHAMALIVAAVTAEE